MKNSTTLRDQTLQIVLVSLAILMGGVFLLTSAVLYVGFTRIERQITAKDMARVSEVFDNIRESLEVKSADWANWDDTYNFVVNRNQEYLISNLNISSLSTLQVNYVLFLDSNDQMVFKHSLDFQSSAPLEMPGDFIRNFETRSPLISKNVLNVVRSGVLMTSQGAVIFVCRPILNSHGQGPSHGSLVFAMIFDQRQLEKLSKTVKLNLRMIPAAGHDPRSIEVKALSWKTIAGFSPVLDVDGKPAFHFYTEIPRRIFNQAILSAVLLFGMLALISVIFIFVIFMSIDRLFLRRLIELTNQVADVGTDGNFSGQISLTGNDELSQVADKINEMLNKIKQSQQKNINDEIRLHQKDKELLEVQKNKVQELENINKLVIQRTKELERMHLANLNILEDFREAKKQAEAASEAKSQFLANMSHEIRTPLNAILGFADLLQKTPLDENQLKYLDTVLSAGKLLLMVVSDILEISKAEAKKISLEIVDFDFALCCRSAFDIVCQKILDRPISTKIELANDLPGWVKGDPMRLKQVLLNVLGNAAKFTDKGSITFRVMRDPTLDDKGKVGIRFEINDTGIGIESDKLGNLFQVFTQVDGSITRKFGGVGLGLAISKNLVNMMGGDIRVESTSGIGSNFIITAAFAVGHPVHASKTEYALENSGAARPRVLVVEDSVPNQQLMKAYFKILGVDGEYVNNGREAVDHLKLNSNFALVFMDMQMPVMGGCEASNIIRRDISIDLPIVALTAAATQDDQDQCFNAGMNDFLTKPIEINKLRETIKRYASGKTVPAPARNDESFKNDLIKMGQEIGLEPDEYKELLLSAMTVIEQDRIALSVAVTNSDYASVKSIAHKLKGTLANMRLNELSKISLQIEELALKQASTSQFRLKEKEFDDLLLKVRKALE